MLEKFGTQPQELSDALARVSAIRQREELRGRIDVERDQFDSIVAALQVGRISAKEAIVKAEAIAENRMDYN